MTLPVGEASQRLTQSLFNLTLHSVLTDVVIWFTTHHRSIEVSGREVPKELSSGRKSLKGGEVFKTMREA